jgi:hypothetical protein
MNIDVDIIDTVPAFSIEVGDQILVDGDPIEVRSISETDDLDEIVIRGYSHDSGDTETYSLFADDTYDVWAV